MSDKAKSKDKNRSGFTLGFDLGGTKMLAAVVDDDYKVLARSKQKTGSEDKGDKIFSRMISTINDALATANLEASQLNGIGIGAPGPLDIYEGVIISTPNLGFENFPLKQRLEEQFGVPVVVENDVNAGTYGEFRFGAAKGKQHVVGLFPGTGLGGGLILNGQLYHGAGGFAGELGHMIIAAGGARCGCGSYGCVEALASRTAIAKELVALAAAGDSPATLAEAGTDLKAVKSRVVAKAVKAEEPEVIEVVKRSAQYLGIAMANCVNIFNPELIVIGGGLVEKLGGFYVKEATKSMLASAMPHLAKQVEVVVAALGDDATALGAAALLSESLAGTEQQS